MPRGDPGEGQESGDDEFAIVFDEEFVKGAPVREPNWKEREREARKIRRQHRKEQQQFKRRRRAARFGGWSDKKGLLILVALVVAGFIFAGLEGRGPLGFLRSDPSPTRPAVTTVPGGETSTTGEPPPSESPETGPAAPEPTGSS